MKNFCRAAAIVILLFSFQAIRAQSLLVTGLIKDSHGVPLIGASITIDGGRTGTITDLGGHYLLKLKPGRHTIAVSYIGYAGQQICLNTCSQNSIERNFTMSEMYRSCSRVVVVSSFRNKNRHTNTITRYTSSDQIKNTEAIMPSRQFELLLLNSLFQN